MSTPHKATERQWGIVRRRAKNDFPDSTDSGLLELAHRVAALEAAFASHGEQISGLHSQHNLVVDNITDLQGCVNALDAAATPSPAPALDHSRGATEMVATDEELIEAFYVGARGALATPGFRAVYNLGRQHSAQPRQEVDPSQLSDGYHTFAELYEHRHALFLALMRAMPQHCWFSLRHADGEKCFGGDDWFIAGAELPGGSSVTYHLPADLYPLAKATGASRLDLGRPWDGHTASDVVSRLMEWAAHPCQEGPPSTPPPAPHGYAYRYPGIMGGIKFTHGQEINGSRLIEAIPYWLGKPPVDPLKEVEPTNPPAPAGGLVESVAGVIWKTCDLAIEARAAIHAVADWLQQRSSTIANGSRWAEMLRTETDRSSAAPPRPVPQPPAPAGGLLYEVARLLANRISLMRPSADCTPLARTVLCVIADAAEKMARDPNLTWERVAIWLDVESELKGRSNG
jgi:hypothetical protein